MEILSLQENIDFEAKNNKKQKASEVAKTKPIQSYLKDFKKFTMTGILGIYIFDKKPIEY